jgi:hypothetical protein
MIKKTVVLIVTFILLQGCSSTTIIKTVPFGAKIYMDGMTVGKTPYVHTDSKILGSRTILKFKKEGYKDFNTVMNKNGNVNVGAVIGGVFVLFPFLWTMDYLPEYTYELEPVE